MTPLSLTALVLSTGDPTKDPPPNRTGTPPLELQGAGEGPTVRVEAPFAHDAPLSGGQTMRNQGPTMESMETRGRWEGHLDSVDEESLVPSRKGNARRVEPSEVSELQHQKPSGSIR